MKKFLLVLTLLLEGLTASLPTAGIEKRQALAQSVEDHTGSTIRCTGEIIEEKTGQRLNIDGYLLVFDDGRSAKRIPLENGTFALRRRAHATVKFRLSSRAADNKYVLTPETQETVYSITAEPNQHLVLKAHAVQEVDLTVRLVNPRGQLCQEPVQITFHQPMTSDAHYHTVVGAHTFKGIRTVEYTVTISSRNVLPETKQVRVVPGQTECQLTVRPMAEVVITIDAAHEVEKGLGLLVTNPETGKALVHRALGMRPQRLRLPEGDVCVAVAGLDAVHALQIHEVLPGKVLALTLAKPTTVTLNVDAIRPARVSKVLVIHEDTETDISSLKYLRTEPHLGQPPYRSIWQAGLVPGRYRVQVQMTNRVVVEIEEIDVPSDAESFSRGYELEIKDGAPAVRQVD